MPELRRAAACAKPARRCPTASPKCARRSTSCATTPRARAHEFARRAALPGPTGEATSCSLRGRGVFVCISPWNFPLAIFTGQVAAALAAGNAVIAKPAEQTPLIAAHARATAAAKPACRAEVLQFLPGDGAIVGARARRGSARRRRRVHRLDRNRDGHQPRAGGARRADRRADRRDRRAERDDRRQLGAAGAGRARCACIGVQQRRPALLGAARAVRAGGHRRQGASRCSPAAWTSWWSAIRRSSSTDVGPVIDDDVARHAARRMPRMHREVASWITRLHSSAPEHERGTFFAPLRGARSIRSRSCTREVFGPVAARRALPARRARRGDRRDQRHRLRPDARHPHAHRRDDRRTSRRACARATSTSTAT